MGLEIERKFLVAHDGWKVGADAGQPIVQGYLVADARRAVRVRLRGDRGTLTIKGPTRGATRAEYEYAIPAADARELLATLARDGRIEKRRHLVRVDGATFEVDVFAGDNAGLVLAEIELASEEEDFPRPDWLGVEVTGDSRYANASLARRPYRHWD